MQQRANRTKRVDLEHAHVAVDDSLAGGIFNEARHVQERATASAVTQGDIGVDCSVTVHMSYLYHVLRAVALVLTLPFPPSPASRAYLSEAAGIWPPRPRPPSDFSPCLSFRRAAVRFAPA